MSKYHAVSSGVITKAALPAITRQRGTTTGSANLMLYGAGKTTVSNNITFIDSSANAFTITRNGSAVQAGYNPFSGVSYGAGYFNSATSDYLQTPTNTALNLSSGDYTVEGWVYLDMTTYSVYDSAGRGIVSDFLANLNGRWIISTNAAGKLEFTEQDALGASSVTVTDPSAISLQKWVYFAAVKSGTTMYLFKNGTLVGTATSAVRTGFQGRINVAQATVDAGYRGYFTGYISNIRLVKGTALYTSNFTPSTSPLTSISGTSLLLLMDNYSIVNSTSTNTPVTINSGASISTAQYPTGMSSSMSFNGTTGYLSFPTFSGFTLGAGAFTFEFFVNSPAVASNTCIIDTRSAAGVAGYFVSINSSQQIVFNYISNYTSTTTLTANTWTHIAIVRIGSTVQMYINGVAESGTFTSSATITAQACNIGQKSLTSSSLVNFGGYLSNMRVVQGSALYTSNFTPPAAPLSTSVTVPNYVTNNIYGVNQIP